MKWYVILQLTRNSKQNSMVNWKKHDNYYLRNFHVDNYSNLEEDYNAL
jgi:hypothetical protein